jgi:hypothetical protein
MGLCLLSQRPAADTDPYGGPTLTLFRSLRALSTLVVMTIALVSIAVALLASTAHASTPCTPPKYPGNGYFTSLEVKNTSCATGKKVAFAWYHCRTKHGAAGKCNSRVLGFSCTEHRVTIPTEFDARVTCHKGSEEVVHTYQQNT